MSTIVVECLPASLWSVHKTREQILNNMSHSVFALSERRVEEEREKYSNKRKWRTVNSIHFM